MNNKELQELFQSLMLETDNIFDVYINLKEHISSYKETNFYKITKFTIYEAFDLYMKGIGGIDYIISLFKNMDEEAMINIMDRISESLSLESTMNQLSDNDKELLNNLLPFIK